MNRRITNPHCPWSVEVHGEDLVVRNVKATCFGGAHDAGDSGQTESGLLNNGSNPALMGIALPIRSTEAATRRSPLAFPGPHIPWETHVWVWEGDDVSGGCDCILIDNGPDVSRFPDHALDLNPNVVRHFFPAVDMRTVANRWSGSGFSYRILGAAKFA